MSSPDLISASTPPNELSFRSMAEEHRQNPLQLPGMGSRAGAGNVSIPTFNLPATGPIPSGPAPSGVQSIFQRYSVYAPQNLEVNVTQIRTEVQAQELEARAEVIHRHIGTQSSRSNKLPNAAQRTSSNELRESRLLREHDR